MAFAEVRKQDTVEAYQRFTNDYPKSRFVGNAKNRIDELRFDAAKQALDNAKAIDTVDAYREFIAAHDESTLVWEARRKIFDKTATAEDLGRLLTGIKTIRLRVAAMSDSMGYATSEQVKFNNLRDVLSEKLTSSGLTVVGEDVPNYDAQLNIYYVESLRVAGTSSAPVGHGTMHTYAITVKFGYELVHPTIGLISHEATAVEPRVMSAMGRTFITDEGDGVKRFQSGDTLDKLCVGLKRMVETGTLAGSRLLP